jgi:hypothetical protein
LLLDQVVTENNEYLSVLEKNLLNFTLETAQNEKWAKLIEREKEVSSSFC